MKDFFENDNISQDQKTDLAFQTVSAIRDTLNIATSTENPKTYENALNLLYDLDLTLYESVVEYVTPKNESEIVKKYKEIATLQSIINKTEQKPESFIKRDVNDLEDLLNKVDSKDANNARFIKAEILRLKAALKNLEPRRTTENCILIHDATLKTRVDGYELSNDGFSFKDYKINDHKSLRIRLLHPDKPEHITGADLIYEHHNLENNEVRFVFLQYKMWEDNDKKISLHENGRNFQQVLKLRKILCDANFCKCSDSKQDINFRFPFCAAFYRPTDRLQIKKNKMVSSGYHIPICNVYNEALNTHQIKKSEIKLNSLNHHLFEKLFNINALGSDWHSYEIVENFYKQNKILEPEETIIIHAKEFNYHSETSDNIFNNTEMDNFDEEPPF